MSKSGTAAFPNPVARVRALSKESPNRPAIVFGDQLLTYGELHRNACAVANGLKALGYAEASRIALLDFNHPSFAEIFLGTVQAGLALSPINARLAPPEVAWILNDSRAPLLFVGSDHFALVEAVESQLVHVETIIAIQGGHARWPSYTEWLSTKPATDSAAVGAPDADIIQLYTSGTTGNPKGVRHSARTWGAAAAAASTALPNAFAFDCVNLVCLPLFHVAGFNPLCFTLSGGGKIVLTRRTDPAEALLLLEKHSVTNTVLVPALIQAMLNVPSRPKGLPALRSLGYGASPIPQDVLARARELFACPFDHLYGMTENAGVATMLPSAMHDPALGKLKSCGKPYPGSEVRVVDEAGNDVPAGTVGEIITRSAWIMCGYWNNAKATAETVRDGWLYTGDAGYVDGEGFLYIHDRIKDMIKPGSENVYPAEVENALFSHPSIADAAVIGVPDARWGEAVKAIVVLRPGATLDTQALDLHMRERLGGFKVPKSYEVVTALPRNASGKVLRRHLREQFVPRASENSASVP